MKDDKDIVEQAENSVSKIGKFNTADDLLAAYNALESEFTKRCQLIKQLQAELEKHSTTQASEQSETPPTAEHEQEQPADAETVQEPPEQEPTVVDPPEEPSKTVVVETAVASGDPDVDFDTLAAAVVGEVTRNAAAYAEMLCALPEIMDACVAKYKQRLIETRVSPSPSGVAVIAPCARPRTLADAKILADRLISKS